MNRVRAFFGELMTLFWGSDPKPYRRAGLKLFLLALLPLAVAWGVGAPGLSEEELRAMRTVRAAQESLWQYRVENGLYPEGESDPDRLGLIGYEWSSTTTTLGARSAKEAACQPGWAAVFLRWFDRLGLEEEDPIVIASSGSFPGLVVSALVAAEERGLDILLLPSLGASTWGANLPGFTLLDQLRFLREKGYVRTFPVAGSLGGGQAENGGGLSPEGRGLLLEAMRRNGVPLLQASDLEGMISLKMARVLEHRARLVIQIGGSLANLGPGPDAAAIPPGLLFPEKPTTTGTGLIGRTLEEGIPVGHLLHVEALARMEGIPYEAKPYMGAPRTSRAFLAVPVILLWFVGLFLHRRWKTVP